MEKTIIVAHIMGKCIGGGVETVVLNYYKNINKRNVQFDFICDRDSTNIPYKLIKKLGGNVILVSPYQNIFKYMKELKKIFKKKNYYIVHSHINTLSVIPLFVAKKCKIPIRIAHSHSTSDKKEIKRNFIKNILKNFSRLYSTDYFACGELAGKYLFGEKTLKKNKVFILNNAIDLENFKYNKTIRNKKRKELNINNETIVIGHVGRFVKQKNHKYLIEIFEIINKLNKNTKLILVGQGPLEDSIKKLVKEKNIDKNVIFLGQRVDVKDLYQAFDIFFLPSLYEGLPVVGIEAQTSGLLCIFSSNITKELKILNNIKFIDLKEEKLKIAKEILLTYKEHFRKNDISKMSKYNIKEESKRLEKKYMELVNRSKNEKYNNN